MKKLFSTLVIVFFILSCKAQYVNVPDSNFRNFLISKFPTCFNVNGQMDTTCSQITSEDSIYCSHGNIESIDGIQYFDNLKYFDCSYNYSIKFLPKLPNTLLQLNASNNKISDFSGLPNNLKRLSIYSQDTTVFLLPLVPSSVSNLNVSYNYLFQLPSLSNTIDSLYISNTFITNLPSNLPMNLKLLECANNNISQLPNLPSTLINLNVSSNSSLNQLPTLPAGLKVLSIGGLKLLSPTTLLLPTGLTDLNCGQNDWVSLPTLPTGLKSLYMSYNNFPVLPSNLPNTINVLHASGCSTSNIIKLPTSLFQFYAMDNFLTTLPSLPTGLTNLTIDRNNIKVLPTLPNTLTYLNWTGNNLDSIKPITITSLLSLRLSDNKLKRLPTLPTNLRYLYIDGNEFDTMPKINSNLYWLDMSWNFKISEIKSLPKTLRTLDCSLDTSLTCLPFLPSFLTNIGLDSTKVECIPNQTLNLGFTHFWNVYNIKEDYPICTPLNNSHNCVSFPTVVGRAFHDYNKNGVWDIGEAPKAFGLIMLSNGKYTFTDTNGLYNVQLDTLGTFSVSLLGSSFYTNVPSIQFGTANRYDTIIYLPNIALKPNKVVDSVLIIATPLLEKARPGFEFPYFVGYANVGTTNLSTSVKLGYAGNYLNYDSCSNKNVVNASNALSHNQNMAAGKTDLYISYFKLKPTATLGDTLKASANITTSTTAFGFDAPYTIISGSYDPNDKNATPFLTPLQVSLAKPIDYIVRFQNTGTDTAFTVVIADTLSNLLQQNTLQVLSSSHTVKTTVKNGVVYFEFKNIKLPDSNVNKIKSNGFVRFTVKPLTTLSLGTKIYNTAYIYFDYNDPIVTNTAVTEVKQPNILPLRFTSFTVKLNNKKITNVFTTSNELNVSHYNIQKSIDGKTFTTIGKVIAKNNASNEYQFEDENRETQVGRELFYRIVGADKDGSLTYSDVRKLDIRNKELGISVYPNPTNGILNIIGEVELKEVQIIDNLGKVVFSKKLKTTKDQLLLNNLTKGYYIVKILTVNNEVRIEKLILN